MKTRLFVLLFLAGSIIPNLLFAQFTQQGPKLVGTNFTGTDREGYSVAISSDGNTAVMGGPMDNNYTGAVWVFTRSGGIWTQQGPKLIGTNNNYGSQGGSVAISADGNTMIEGGSGDNSGTGAVWVFTRSGGVWTQQGLKLVGTGAVGRASQGSSVSISADGNTMIEGGVVDSSSVGAAWVFTRSGGVWTQQDQKVVGTGGVGNFVYQGSSVSLSADGNTAVVGGNYDNSSTGAIWVFTRSGSVWTQQGSKLVGTGGIGDIIYQGNSVSVSSDGNTIIESGNFDNSGAGASWIFNRSGGIWSQQGPKISRGRSVAITPDGNIAIVGSPKEDECWIYTRSSGVWTEQSPALVGTGSYGSASQGSSVAISSEGTVIESDPYDDLSLGAAWVFHNPTLGIAQISDLPSTSGLEQNYPNPFNQSTKLKFQISKSSDTKLTVYDLTGREVSMLVNEQLAPGTYEVDFDGSKFAGGTYFYKLEISGFVEMKKMILIK